MVARQLLTDDYWSSPDDLATFRTIPVVLASHGCAGEWCDGIHNPCATCLAGTVTTVVAYVPPF